MESMPYALIFPSYFYWHYSAAYKDMIRVWSNLLTFCFEFFSISILLRTFFSPWRRIEEGRTKEGFHPEDIAEMLMTNTVMRIVGALMRSFVLIVGLLTVLFVFWVGLLAIILWGAIPVLLPMSFIYGISFLI